MSDTEEREETHEENAAAANGETELAVSATQQQQGTLAKFNELCREHGFGKSYIDEKNPRTRQFRSTVRVTDKNTEYKNEKRGQWKPSHQKARASAAGTWIKEFETLGSVSGKDGAMKNGNDGDGNDDAAQENMHRAEMEFALEALCHCTLKQANFVRFIGGLEPIKDTRKVQKALLRAREAFLENLGVDFKLK